MPSNSTPAPDPKLATEAKLCAYLEGTLPPEDRTEIESYLQHNPQHRQLLKELRGTRELLQHLPAENAPPEIAESFEQQLERSLLLDDLAIESAPARRGGPQKLLIAALVLLACGLAVVIYLSLPGPAIPPQKLAALFPIPATEAATLPPATLPVAVPAPATVPTVAMTPATAPATPPGSPLPAAPQPSFDQARALLAVQSVPPGQTALLTLRSDDPAAPTTVADYFRASVIPVQRLAGPETAPATRPAMLSSTTAPAVATRPTTQSTGHVLNATTPDRSAFLARNLSAGEATRLQAELSAAYPGDAVQFFEPSAWNPPQPPATIAADQPLTVTVDQLIGPGVEKTNTVRVSADGTVMLPMLLEPIPAAGLSMADLQTRIADRYRDAHLISHAAVTVVPGPADSQPAAGANSPVTTEPVAALVPPTTAAAPAESGQPLNLLVLLLHPDSPPTPRASTP